MTANLWKRNTGDREMHAFSANLQEDRLLERTLKTLQLEESYALQILQLGHKEIRAGQRRLQKRVGKIRSRLSTTEIFELRSLEQSGKLVTTGPSLAVNGSQRIAAAAKLLKLGPKRVRQRPRTAHPTVGRTEDEPLANWVKSARCVQRPLTSDVTSRSRPIDMLRRPKTAPTVYSSHVIDSDERLSARLPINRPPKHRGKQRRVSEYSEDSVEVAQQKAKQSEVMRILLENEMCTANELAQRQHAFIDDLTRWLDANPAANMNCDLDWQGRRSQTPASANAERETRSTGPTRKKSF